MHSDSTLIGFLGRDPVLHSEPGRKTFATFSVATHRYSRNEQGEAAKVTTWHHVVAWEKTAEDLAQRLHKGSLVWVRGRLEYRDWKDRKNTLHRTAEIHVTDWQLLRQPEADVEDAENADAAEDAQDAEAGPASAPSEAPAEPPVAAAGAGGRRGRRRPVAH